jgi:hypothetical protein
MVNRRLPVASWAFRSWYVRSGWRSRPLTGGGAKFAECPGDLFVLSNNAPPTLSRSFGSANSIWFPPQPWKNFGCRFSPT